MQQSEFLRLVSLQFMSQPVVNEDLSQVLKLEPEELRTVGSQTPWFWGPPLLQASASLEPAGQQAMWIRGGVARSGTTA